MDHAQGTIRESQAPPEVRIRTFTSDLRSMHEAGTGFPQFKNVSVAPAQVPALGKPSSKILIYLILGAIILAAVGTTAYFISAKLK